MCGLGASLFAPWDINQTCPLWLPVLAERALPYHQIMKITGHKKLTTLQRYIKSKADIDLMLQVVNNI
jgi:hypothetical protein